MLSNSNYITEIANALGIDTTQALDLVQNELQSIAVYKLASAIFSALFFVLFLIIFGICAICFYRLYKKYESKAKSIKDEYTTNDETDWRLLNKNKEYCEFHNRECLFWALFYGSVFFLGLTVIVLIVWLFINVPTIYGWLNWPDLMLANVATDGAIL